MTRLGMSRRVALELSKLALALAVLVGYSPDAAYAIGSWKLQFGPTDLIQVTFVDTTHGWAVGYNGIIAATADGGRNWTTQPSGTDESLWSVAFADATHGWAVGYDTILSTTDGGAHWTPQDPSAVVDFNVVAFANTTHGWAMGHGTILATTDGGAHWIPQTSPTGNALWSVSSADASRAWAVGDGGTIISTTDGGANWTTQTSPTASALRSVAFADSAHGWAVGDGGTIISTTDGGANWTSQTSPNSHGLCSVSFVDAAHGWAVGDGGTIISTTDGGANWTSQTSPTANALWSVSFVDAAHGWASGGASTMLGYDEATFLGEPIPASPFTGLFTGGYDKRDVYAVDVPGGYNLCATLIADGDKFDLGYYRPEAPQADVLRPIDHFHDSDSPWWTTVDFTAPSDAGGIYYLCVDSNSTSGSYQVQYTLGPVPHVVADPSLDFGSVDASDKKSMSAAITNEGVAPLTITGVSLTGYAAGDFRIADMTWPRVLAPGAELQVPVAFAPVSAPSGTPHFVDLSSPSPYAVFDYSNYMNGVLGAYTHNYVLNTGGSGTVACDVIITDLYGSHSSSVQLPVSGGQGYELVTHIGISVSRYPSNAGVGYVASLPQGYTCSTTIASASWGSNGYESPRAGWVSTTLSRLARASLVIESDDPTNPTLSVPLWAAVTPRITAPPPTVRSTTTRLSAPSSAKVKKTLKLAGTVRSALAPGKVTIKKTRLVGKTWKSAGSAKVSVVRGSFRYSFKPRYKGKWRFVATYSGGKVGTTTYRSSKSATKGVKVK